MSPQPSMSVPPPLERPKVSVCMITYKHAEYIGEAIESVLAQRTNFAVELVIGDDCSSDATAAVAARYQTTMNVHIRRRSNAVNLGMQGNFALTLSECRGDYIALLEGDDYWTDSAKLQRQADFLDANPDFAICFHPVQVWRNGAMEADARTREVPAATDIRDLAQGNFMHTCSVLFRARQFDELPASFGRASAGDFFLHMLNARFGRIAKLPQTMAVYRVHDGGAWSAHADIDLKILQYLECMIGNFEPEIDQILMQRHQDIAFRSFVQRVAEPGVAERMQRCIRFGSQHFADQVAPLVRRAKAFDEKRLLRLIKRFV